MTTDHITAEEIQAIDDGEFFTILSVSQINSSTFYVITYERRQVELWQRGRYYQEAAELGLLE